ncbi:MAG: septal ring lytic transglycosylase RlpA family protein [Patescibacteria group bacterium]
MKKVTRNFIIIAFFIGISFGIYEYYVMPREDHREEEALYAVQPRDSVEKIARKFKVLPWQLRLANGMTVDDTLLQPGQMLIIPRPKWRAYEGKASWYGTAFHGKVMANGNLYDQDKISIAHRTLPLGKFVKIINISNGRMIMAEVLDRGPYAVDENGKYKREIDLSRAAAEALDAIEKGVISVRIEPLHG